MNSAVNIWGPALLVCFTVLVGILTNNKRIDDLGTSLRSEMAALSRDLIARIDGLEKRLSTAWNGWSVRS